MAIPPVVAELVERFQRDIAAYRSPYYNEAQTRQEFIDPFFQALGWDMSNAEGSPVVYREVVHEDTLKISGKSKAPDYSFRLGGIRQFFVEAKKPAVNLEDDTRPAFQVRRYGWSAKLPVSILTDFEEFAVYDCRIVPDSADKASVGRTLYIPYHQYAERWDEIASLFSREAVLDGSLDKYTETLKSKRGVAAVDDAFLGEIERWREILARDIAGNNQGLSQHALNFAVQMTIDRVVFLRICEDRGIEPYESLKGAATGDGTYEKLCRLFRRADERYNSGLFHFQQEKGRQEAPDDFTLSLTVSDASLQGIINGLYYPHSPYEFSVVGADILGQVYEQFLGKVIRLTTDQRVVVEVKPEVRKAGGVYYTPVYIVDYIVRHAVGGMLEGKTVRQAARIKILDPACGSGSFLIGAYQYLLDWHRDQYLAAGNGRPKNKLYQAPTGEWRLTTDERKRILLNNIYGVDVDVQAVETTKLSLLLKVLEDESQQTLVQQLQLFQERALPDLGENIKSGNSLIGPDFYDNVQDTFLETEEAGQVNVLDWHRAFPNILSGESAGFDVVIGNPPYIRVHRLSDAYKTYLWTHYDTFVAKSDIYACFIQKGLQILRPGGRLAFITPNTWSSLESFTRLRQLVLEQTAVERMVRAPERVFRDATVRTFVFVLRKAIRPTELRGAKALVQEMAVGGAVVLVGEVAQQDMRTSHLQNLLLHSGDEAPALFAKCTETKMTVGSEFQFFYGFKTGDDDRFLSGESERDSCVPFVRSADVTRFGSLRATGFVDYRPDTMRAHRSTARPGDRQRFERPKVIVARMGKRLITTFDSSGMFGKDAMLLLSATDDQNQLKMLTGLLNSRLLQYLYENHFATIDVLKNALLALPLPSPQYTSTDASMREKLVSLVNLMLDLGKRLSRAQTNYEKNTLNMQAGAIEKQLDKLVYRLFKLSESEITVVEGNES